MSLLKKRKPENRISNCEEHITFCFAIVQVRVRFSLQTIPLAGSITIP
ncbi:MAG: hypothetical protein LBL39_07780 [Planctomycetaceae bacterium]|nr:hypothetical protein [Planctomycetaceae bacterium]